MATEGRLVLCCISSAVDPTASERTYAVREKESPPKLETFSNRRRALMIYLELADLQVFEMCFMFCTVSVGCGVAPAGVPVAGLVAVEAEVVAPVICTSCPTCALSFEVSP
jgi:hypothetical protein